MSAYAVAHVSPLCCDPRCQEDPSPPKKENAMNRLIWIVGLVVIVLFILGYLGLR